MIDKLLQGLGKSIKISIEVPTGHEHPSTPPIEKSPCAKRYRLKKAIEGKKEDSIDNVDLGDTLFRHLLPDMNSKNKKG